MDTVNIGFFELISAVQQGVPCRPIVANCCCALCHTLANTALNSAAAQGWRPTCFHAATCLKHYVCLNRTATLRTSAGLMFEVLCCSWRPVCAVSVSTQVFTAVSWAAMLLQKSCSHFPALASHTCSRSEGIYFVLALHAGPAVCCAEVQEDVHSRMGVLLLGPCSAVLLGLQLHTRQTSLGALCDINIFCCAAVQQNCSSCCCFCCCCCCSTERKQVRNQGTGACCAVLCCCDAHCAWQAWHCRLGVPARLLLFQRRSTSKATRVNRLD
jgi:hypothetical protein